MSDQLQEFIHKADTAVNPPDTSAAVAADPNAPRVPFATALKLTRQQEDRMIEHAFKRMKELENESGRDVTQGLNWWQNQVSGNVGGVAGQGQLPSETFMGKRSRFDAMFLNDWTWRPYCYPQPNIFQTSNFSTPVVRRIARQMIARAKNSFFGADPWFSIDPAPVVERDAQDDAGRADKIEKFVRYKFKESGSKLDKKRAIERALILGECPVKTAYVVRDSIFNVETRVLHGVDGQPVRAADGNFITESDTYVDAEDGTGQKVLARDGETPEPLAPIWQTLPLDRRQILFQGAKSEPIYFKDFLMTLTAANVQEADMAIHIYDKSVTEFVGLVVKGGMIADDTPERLDAARKMVALIKDLSENTNAPKAAVTTDQRPNDHFFAGSSTESGGPVAGFAEFWMWFDCYGDGVPRNIMFIADRQTRAPIFYDHVANTTTDGLRPIEIVRINAVEGRWYGQGIMELFESYQTQTDLLINRWNAAQSRAGRVDFWRPSDTLEGDREPNLKLNWGSTYTAKPGVDIEKILKVVYLTDIKFEQTQIMAQFFMQLLMNESGVSNANDDQAAGMQSAKLATGILEVAKAGSELFQPIIDDLQEPLERIATREIDVTLANMDPVEVFTYLEGETKGVDRLTPDDVKGLKFKVSITLTTHRNQEKLQIGQAASALVERFYQLDPLVQVKVASFYRQQIQALDPKCDVDTVIDPMKPQPAATEPTKSGITVSIKWETLDPTEKTLFAKLIGVDDKNPPPAAPPPASGGSSGDKKTNGSIHKLGEKAPDTQFETQLSQRANKKA